MGAYLFFEFFLLEHAVRALKHLPRTPLGFLADWSFLVFFLFLFLVVRNIDLKPRVVDPHLDMVCLGQQPLV